jgi:chromosome segregation ATPase
MPWAPKINPKQLKKQNEELAIKLTRAREALTISERRRETLEIVLTARLNRISELNGKIDSLRRQNQKLDAEAEHLAAIIKSEGFILHANPQGRC